MPRSGTNLACALLNECPQTVALAEPLQLERHGDRERAVREIGEFIGQIRHRLLREGVADTIHVGGAIPDNWVEEPRAGGALRHARVERGPVRFDKPLSEDFRLVVKHPGEFSALADLLDRRYPLIALIRHPLAVLASWQTVDLPVRQGHMPVAEAFDPELASLLAGVPDRLERQVALMGWLLSRYAAFEPGQVLRYEDMIADPAAALAKFGVRAGPSSRSLAGGDPSVRYPSVDLRPLAEALRAIAPLGERFYPGFATSLKTPR
jgi:hypothetical protein